MPMADQVILEHLQRRKVIGYQILADDYQRNALMVDGIISALDEGRSPLCPYRAEEPSRFSG